MNKSSKALKNRYRGLCTHIIETKDGSGRVSRQRVRREGSPPLKEWASATEPGKAWLERKRRGR